MDRTGNITPIEAAIQTPLRLDTMRFEELVPALHLSISPVIMISGVGLVLLSMTNRYGRVIDQARIIREALCRDPDEAPERLTSELVILCRRARLLRLAILLASTSLLCSAVLIMALFMASLLESGSVAAIVALFPASMLTLMASLTVFLLDINASLAAFDLETRLEVHHRLEC